MKAEVGKFYKLLVKYHRTDDLREGAVPNGSTIFANAVWIADNDENFSGDVIFQPAECSFWIPERDVEVIEEIPFKQYIDKLTELNP